MCVNGLLLFSPKICVWIAYVLSNKLLNRTRILWNNKIRIHHCRCTWNKKEKKNALVSDTQIYLNINWHISLLKFYFSFSLFSIIVWLTEISLKISGISKLFKQFFFLISHIPLVRSNCFLFCFANFQRHKFQNNRIDISTVCASKFLFVSKK